MVALKEKIGLCHGDSACEQKVTDEYIKLSRANDQTLQAECQSNPTGPACQGHIQAALNYAGDKQETNGIAGSMGADINRSRTVVLDQTLNGGSYSAVNNIEARADFFGAMGQQTGAPWFNSAEDVSRNDLQGEKFAAGDILNIGNLTKWRDAAGNEIMGNGLNNFQSIYNNDHTYPPQNVNNWSVNQLVNEQNDPKLQAIHQQYINPLTRFLTIRFEGVDLLNPASRINAGCIRMGMSVDCGGQ